MALHPFNTNETNHAITAKTYISEAFRDADIVWRSATKNINKIVKIEDIDAYQILVSTGPSVWQTISGDSFAGNVAVAADALVIPVTARFVSKETGGDAEALTLADGVPGQHITISLTTDGGGDGTLTPVTSTGWATVVFGVVGDTVHLEYIDDTVGWIMHGAWGTAVALTPLITL